MFYYFFMLLACVCYTNADGIYAHGVGTQDANTIVNGHNGYRLNIANGRVPGQPRGSNLRRLKWDASLAAAAQNIANRCVFGHVAVKDNRFYVGQNIYASYSSAYDKSGANWGAALQAWFNEYKNYRYPNNPASNTGHYTQMVWANTQYVGCGYAYCLKQRDRFPYQKFYVCNYGPGGNINGQAPYRQGSGCQNLC